MSNEVASDQSLEPTRPRRLRVWHFFLFATACAIAVATRTHWTDWENIPKETESYARSQIAFFSLLYGVAAGCLCLFAWQRYRTGRAAVTAPGHWLLMFAGMGVLIDATVELVISICQSPSALALSDFDAWNLNKILICGLVALNCFVCAYCQSGSWWWKSTLIFPGCVLAALVPQHFFALNDYWRPWFATSHNYAQLLTSPSIVLLLAIAISKDWREQGGYDWLHWVGVGVVLLYSAGGCAAAAGWLYYYS